MIIIKENPRDILDELLQFSFKVYTKTGGAYPMHGWGERKPAVGDWEAFEKTYRPVIEWRIEEEFDEFFVGRSEQTGEIVSTLAIAYSLSRKNLPWISDKMKRRKGAVLLTFFLVYPRGKGYGVSMLYHGISHVRKQGKCPFIISPANTEALDYFKRRGFEEFERFGEHVILRYPRYVLKKRR
ncbi:GNAT family N-acetyltransferase [Thermococcus sp. GR6]|uniref:GNAT family N-acetyltransferase n=1 Tax=Thermococcus sp. GR6 TaxID=1638256 RepID=UPI001430413C|nr:GNAT family N-acetyltransferase [Thermococcus sp. GR6]NJE41966.1 GNAT family N-acetyltransferase [Thermococcus sp. GR6]